MPELTPAEKIRYARHLAIPEFGLEGQHKLKEAGVLVIGAGGLGSPLLLYLAAAGVGRLGIVDFDTVDETNLQRQVLYTIGDLGRSKAETARQKLLALNPHIQVTVYNEPFTVHNARELVRQYDVVADGTDNFPTRYLTNDACVLEDKVNVYASIFRFEGQVSVFNYPQPDGSRGPNYRDLFPTPPPPGMVPSCAEGGVLGVLPGIIGSLQANEVIKVITGLGDPLSGRLFLLDAASFTTRILRVKKNPDTRITGLINYEEFCGIIPQAEKRPVKEITPRELKAFMDAGVGVQLIDVREPFETDIATLHGHLIPPDRILAEAGQIARDKQVILYCRSGRRSADAIRQLEDELGLDNLYNLKGGILAWSEEVDPEMVRY